MITVRVGSDGDTNARRSQRSNRWSPSGGPRLSPVKWLDMFRNVHRAVAARDISGKFVRCAQPISFRLNRCRCGFVSEGEVQHTAATSELDTEQLGRTVVMTRSHSASERKRKIGADALEAVGRQQWLDRPGYRLEHVLAVAFASFGRNRDRVSNALHGTWLGH